VLPVAAQRVGVAVDHGEQYCQLQLHGKHVIELQPLAVADLVAVSFGHTNSISERVCAIEFGERGGVEDALSLGQCVRVLCAVRDTVGERSGVRVAVGLCVTFSDGINHGFEERPGQLFGLPVSDLFHDALAVDDKECLTDGVDHGQLFAVLFADAVADAVAVGVCVRVQIFFANAFSCGVANADGLCLGIGVAPRLADA
jgi:hypothetical protein